MLLELKNKYNVNDYIARAEEYTGEIELSSNTETELGVFNTICADYITVQLDVPQTDLSATYTVKIYNVLNNKSDTVAVESWEYTVNTRTIVSHTFIPHSPFVKITLTASIGTTVSVNIVISRKIYRV